MKMAWRKPFVLGVLLFLLASSSEFAMARTSSLPADGALARRMGFEWPWEWCLEKGLPCPGGGSAADERCCGELLCRNHQGLNMGTCCDPSLPDDAGYPDACIWL